MSSWITAEAPSNIALIKYMGKRETLGNISTNSSLSFTLDHLRTRVRVRWESAAPGEISWRPLIADGMSAPKLSENGRARYIAHASRCLKALGDGKSLLERPEELLKTNSLAIESANGFPADCGLASSASSFAALTLAIAELGGVDTKSLASRMKLAELSRQGSGSSCRSLFSPWSIWKSEGAGPCESLPSAKHLRHLAIIVDSEKKAVSSSEAHSRVTSSLLFRGRIERAEERLQRLIDQLRRAAQSEGSDGVHAWNRAARIVWAESWDMHALFETSEPPFGYLVPGSVSTLNALRKLTIEMKIKFGEEKIREPLVTMDAGPNVHVLLWNDDWTDGFVSALRARLGSVIRVIDSKGSR